MSDIVNSTCLSLFDFITFTFFLDFLGDYAHIQYTQIMRISIIGYR